MTAPTPRPLAPPTPPGSTAWLWTWPLRSSLGAVIGWVAADVGASRRAGGWLPIAAALVLAAVAAVAPSLLALTRGRGVPPGLALGSLAGLYVGIPETEHLFGIGVALAALMVGQWACQADESWPVVLTIGALVIWSAVYGGSFRNGALLAGLSSVGLLVLAPLAARLPGPGRVVPEPLVAPGLLVAQLMYAVALGRLVGLRDGAIEGLAVAAAATAVLVVATRVILGPPR